MESRKGEKKRGKKKERKGGIEVGEKRKNAIKWM